MMRTLVIGYGNLDRGDDGVAYAVVNGLRKALSLEPLDEEETGLERLGGGVDAIFLRQLVPELMETAAAYDRLVFVDAHVGDRDGELAWRRIVPAFVPSAFTHHLTPATFLALMRVLYDRAPAGYLLSIRGRTFDFRRGLSEAAAGLVGCAVEKILENLSV